MFESKRLEPKDILIKNLKNYCELYWTYLLFLLLIIISSISHISSGIFSNILNSPAPLSHSPPSIVTTSPFTKAEKSEIRYAARFANSWCTPNLPTDLPIPGVLPIYQLEFFSSYQILPSIHLVIIYPMPLL